MVCRLVFSLSSRIEPRYFHPGKGEHGRADDRAVIPQGFVPALIDGGHLFIQSLARSWSIWRKSILSRRCCPHKPAERAFV